MLKMKFARLSLPLVGMLKLNTGFSRFSSICAVFDEAKHEVLVPHAIDWRERGAVNIIKNQGEFGTCWAFAAVAAVEGIIQIKTGVLHSLSEQHLIDLCHNPLGDIQRAYKCIIENGGLNSSQAYPYRGYRRKRTPCSTTVGSIHSYGFVRPYDEQALKLAVSRQPVAVGISCDYEDFGNYKTGVFRTHIRGNVGHAVTIVGYDTTDEGIPYWIIRNSWGEEWGEKGYMKMFRNTKRRTGLCALSKEPIYPIM